jgi:flavodoxin
MSVLTVFYSRTGTTKNVAESISRALSCDIEEIIDTKNRTGPLAYIASGREARKKKLAVIQPVKKNPQLYDVVVIGTPIWAGTMATPVRTYISQNKEHFKKVAFFCTCGGTDADRTFEAMKDLCEKEMIASLAIRTKETKNEEHLQKIDAFVNTIKTATSSP